MCAVPVRSKLGFVFVEELLAETRGASGLTVDRSGAASNDGVSGQKLQRE